MRRVWVAAAWAVALVSALSACDDDGPTDDSTEDCGPGACVLLDGGGGTQPPDAAPGDAEPLWDGDPPDGAPPEDAEPPVPDAADPDAAGPDAAGPDAAVPDAEPPDAAPRCGRVEPAPPPGPGGLAHATVRAELAVGAAVRDPALWVGDLDGDAAGSHERVVARGGRVALIDADGAERWRTGLTAAWGVLAVADFDGDGRAEVVTRSDRDVFVYDGVGGDLRWTLPLDLFDLEAPRVGVQEVRVLDVTGDGLPDLYLTDAGCSRSGQGFGAVISFTDDPAGALVARIQGPRFNGRCTRWNTFGDVDGDGRPELLVNDAVGLQVFDPRTGDRLACGEVSGAVTAGIYPNLPLPTDAGEDRLVFEADHVARLGLQDGPVARCPDDARSFRPRWRVALGGTARPEGSVVVDVDGDGLPDLLTSVRRAGDDVWQVVALSGADGGVLFTREDAVLLGGARLGPEDALTLALRSPPGDVAGRFGELLLARLADDGLRLVDGPSLPGAALVLPAQDPPERSEEFPAPLVVGEALAVLRADPARPDAVAALELWTLDGRVAQRPLEGEPGAVRGACGHRPDCAHAALARPDGVVEVLDAALQPVGDAAGARLLAGAVSVYVADDASLLAVAPDGRAMGLDWQAAAPVAWSAAAGLNASGRPLGATLAPREDAPDQLLLGHVEPGALGWRALGADDGQPRWTHLLPASAVASLAAPTPIPPLDLVVRHDRLIGDAPPPLGDCARETIEDGAFPPTPECVGVRWVPRQLTAIDQATGACRWRTVLRPQVNCGVPGNNLQLTYALGHLYLTGSENVRRIDPLTGEVTAQITREDVADASRLFGGWVRPTGAAPPLVRIGGLGPPDALDVDLAYRGSAPNVEGQRLQGWLIEDIVVAAGELWMTPEVGLPIHRYGLADDLPLRGTFALRAGALEADAAVEAAYPDVTSMQRVDALLGAEAPGLALTTDEGILYALDPAGALVFARAFEVGVGRPRFGNLDDDAGLELAVPTTDGRLLVLDEPAPPGPLAAWDVPCGAGPTCDPADDIDATFDATTLCVEWLPLPDDAAVVGYEVRVLGENGALVRDWAPAGADTRTAAVGGLALVPGQAYTVEVRAVGAEGPPTRPTSSDGVVVINEAPPEVSVRADRATLDIQGVEPVTLTLEGRDDDRLAGWSLAVLSVEGRLVRRLGAGPLADPEVRVVRAWDAFDQAKTRVAPGRYRVVGAVVDRAGNVARDEVLVQVCDGPC